MDPNRSFTEEHVVMLLLETFGKIRGEFWNPNEDEEFLNILDEYDLLIAYYEYITN